MYKKIFSIFIFLLLIFSITSVSFADIVEDIGLTKITNMSDMPFDGVPTIPKLTENLTDYPYKFSFYTGEGGTWNISSGYNNPKRFSVALYASNPPIYSMGPTQKGFLTFPPNTSFSRSKAFFNSVYDVENFTSSTYVETFTRDYGLPFYSSHDILSSDNEIFFHQPPLIPGEMVAPVLQMMKTILPFLIAFALALLTFKKLYYLFLQILKQA